MTKLSLRTRLLLLMVVLLVTGIAITDVVTVSALRSYLTDQLDRQLQSARGPLGDRVREDARVTTNLAQRPLPPVGQRGFGFSDFYVEIHRPDGTIEVPASIVRNEDEPLPALSGVTIASHLDKGPFTVDAVGDRTLTYRVVAASNSSGSMVILAAPLNVIDNTVNRLIAIEVVVTLIVLVVLVAIGWVIVRADLRPLEHMADTATAIAGGDLSRRVDRVDDKTEVGRLGGAFNAMLHQIESSFAERERSAERLRQFAADASHELRTPLTAVRGYAELYRQGAIADTEHLTRVMGRIESEATRMQRVVEDLLLLARLDQGRGVERSPVDVVALVNDVVSDAQAIDPTRSITWSQVSESTESIGSQATESRGSVIVDGDRERLHQVFANLVTNALVHTPDGTPVRVTVRVESREVVVAVSDDGPGLASEAAGKVFERFFRVDSGRSREVGGAGLGLAIVQSLVEAHQGTVSVESTVGEGATFFVRLPLARVGREG